MLLGRQSRNFFCSILFLRRHLELGTRSFRWEGGRRAKQLCHVVHACKRNCFLWKHGTSTNKNPLVICSCMLVALWHVYFVLYLLVASYLQVKRFPTCSNTGEPGTELGTELGTRSQPDRLGQSRCRVPHGAARRSSAALLGAAGAHVANQR